MRETRFHLKLPDFCKTQIHDEFFAAIDSDDFKRAASLMKKANVDAKTIAIVLQKMGDADREH